MAFDPFALDRDIARGARAARRFLRALRRDLPSAEMDHPLAPLRWVAGKTTFDEVSASLDELDQYDTSALDEIFVDVPECGEL